MGSGACTSNTQQGPQIFTILADIANFLLSEGLPWWGSQIFVRGFRSISGTVLSRYSPISCFEGHCDLSVIKNLPKMGPLAPKTRDSGSQ